MRPLTTIQKLWAKVFSKKRRGLKKSVRWLQLNLWIVRGQHRIVHALLLSWVHVLVVGLPLFAALTVHAPADSGMPWIFPLAKWVAALYQCMLLLDSGQRISRSWKQHRRFQLHLRLRHAARNHGRLGRVHGARAGLHRRRAATDRT
jgi:hypothetical protein